MVAKMMLRWWVGLLINSGCGMCWETEEESLVGGADGSKDDAKMVGGAINQ